MYEEYPSLWIVALEAQGRKSNSGPVNSILKLQRKNK